MSEEEIIKEINIIKEIIIDILKIDTENYIEDIYNIDTKQFKAILGLLDLYNKEKILAENHKTAFEKQTENLHEIENLYKKEKEENKKLRNCHLRYEEMTGIDLLLED